MAFLRIIAATAVLALASGTALAQIAVTDSIGGDVNLNASNSGSVTLNAKVTDPTVAGKGNSVGLGAQGAVVSFDGSGRVRSITDSATGDVSVSVTGANMTSTSSGGTTTVNGTISGLTQSGTNANASISATGVSSGITINTTRSNSAGN